MPLGKKMPNGTRVKHQNTGRVGKTLEWLPNKVPVGGYRVQWDHDSSEEEVSSHLLDLQSGNINIADYNNAVQRVTQSLGGYEAKPEGKWLNNGRLVDSVLIVSKPSYLAHGEEMHAHAGMGGGIQKAHVKNGNVYVRNVYQNGKFTNEATAKDKEWFSQIKLRNSLIASKQDYLDGKKQLPS